MRKLAFHTILLAVCLGAAASAMAQKAPKEKVTETVCFESRKGASEITQREIQPGLPNVKCSPTTGAALWYADPYEGTVDMGKMPLLEQIPEGQAVVKPRSNKLKFLPMCTGCHNSTLLAKLPVNRKPIPIPSMARMLPELKNLQHGRGRIWCFDCHHPTERNRLVDHYGDPVSFDQPQQLCGKCHGDKLRDWRDGIHGKRIGEFASTGKKRWFVCTECHNPHDVQDGARNRSFVQLQPEPPPQLPKGMTDAQHETRPPIPH